jgi:phospholipase C
MRSPNWKSSAFIWSYDVWGGWYDHVKPPQVDRFGYGFRVPALLVSPYARKGYVDHDTNDFTSILRFVEVNWNLRPLAQRDRRANDLMEAFDFRRPPRPAVILTTQRHVVPPERLDTTPVYGAYLSAVGLSALLVLLARTRTRRKGSHPEALLSDDMIEGRERP